jgi:small subunit ribosomal protein S20
MPEADPEERMPHHKSAVKRVRTNKRDQTKNIAVRSELKSLLKKMADKPTDKDVMKMTVSQLDRAVKKGVVKKAVANRRKSRLALAANRAMAKK